MQKGKPMPDLTIAVPETAPLHVGLVSLADGARAIVITDRESHGIAVDIDRQLVMRQRAIVAAFEPAKKNAHATHKAVCDLEKKALAPVEAARAVLTPRIAEYEAEARRKAEAESNRLAAIARAAEEERQIEEAIAAEAEGDTQAAEAILDEPVNAPAVTVAPAVAKAEGQVDRRTYRAEITDPVEFISWLATQPAGMHSRAADACLPLLNARAREQREAMRIPGVRVVVETSRSFRA
jgi:hypothetical protein